MSASNGKITHDRLLELVHYEPDAGVFTARIRRSKGALRAGDRLGTTTRDGLVVTLDGKNYPLHNLAWFYIHGEWPSKQLLKLDGDNSNVAIVNLALPTAAKRGDLTQERLRFVLRYDRDAGLFTWLVRPAKNIAAGSRAGRVDPSGHTIIAVDGVEYTAQRLAWLYEHGKLPDRPLRFLDNNQKNFAIGNLIESVSEFASRAEQDKHWRQRNPDKVRRMGLRNDFGITIEVYHQMFEAQGGVCAACKKPETATRNGKVKWLAVDHCHDTNIVRGLACAACNMAIGLLGDDPAKLRAAADYIERSRSLACDDPSVIRLTLRSKRATTTKKEAA